MPSLRAKATLRRQIFLALIGKVESQLRDLYAHRSEEGYTQAAAAERLGIDRSAITRRLNGRTNMTLETVADMVWAGGGCIELEIFDPGRRARSNHSLPVFESVAYAGLSPSHMSVSTPRMVTFSAAQKEVAA